MNILLKTVTIVDPTNKDLHLKKKDILIKNGFIDSIAQKIPTKGKVKVLDFDNLHVSKGWFDSSVSFGEPGYEERETIANGLLTAAKSGFTDIVLNANAKPVPDTSADIVFLKNASSGHATNLHPMGALTMAAQGQDLAELYDMQNSGAVAFSDHKHAISNSNLLKIALQYAQNFDGLVYSFPQDKNITGKGIVNEGEVSTRLGLKGIPALAEELQIARDLHILEYTGGKLHFPTISSAESVNLIADAKKKGLDVSCSVALHNLYFTDEVLNSFDSNFKLSPPIRTANDRKVLREGVKKGTIDFVTTDHSPMNIEQKQVEFDNALCGTIGLESAFGIANDIFGLESTIKLFTKGRERYGLEKPEIKKGAKANLTLFNPEGESTFEKIHILSSSQNSAFVGSKTKGMVYGAINNNQAII
jgi:dihydroorotase